VSVIFGHDSTADAGWQQAMRAAAVVGVSVRGPCTRLSLETLRELVALRRIDNRCTLSGATSTTIEQLQRLGLATYLMLGAPTTPTVHR
jgi:hypothetical protein